MDMQEIIKNAKNNIRQAIKDYAAHTYRTEELDKITEDFIGTLAYDSSYAKQELRELFSKSPAYNPELDAIVINGNRTHEPDYNLIESIMDRILYPAASSTSYNRRTTIWRAETLFLGAEGEARERAIQAINELAPHAYHPGRKLSKVFKALCDALGVSNNEPGSEFQRMYAQLADEMSAKKIDFKLFVSINPAHFLTMSNPKDDKRGNTLTSCHSFNSTEYSYNNGCTGYACDNVTFIVFTVADPTDRETLNNRKTTRQIFAYKPGNGLLLQSRLYNTSGGTRGAQAESAVYRDLVQREISDLEGAVNLWKTYKVCSDNHRQDIYTGDGFGGYEDWIYEDFDAKVSIRIDHETNYHPLTVGTYGRCIICGEETSDGLYCDECKEEEGYYCQWCEEYHSTTNRVRDRYGDWIDVCDNCLENDFTYCEMCDEYHPSDRITWVDDTAVCDYCIEERCHECANCGELHFTNNMIQIRDSEGDIAYVCDNCLDSTVVCEECGERCLSDDIYIVHDANGEVRGVCRDCRDNSYEECKECGEYWPEDMLVNGKCPECIKEAEDVA